MENLSEEGHCHGHDGNTTAPILEAEAGVLSLRLAWTAEENSASKAEFRPGSIRENGYEFLTENLLDKNTSEPGSFHWRNMSSTPRETRKYCKCYTNWEKRGGMNT